MTKQKLMLIFASSAGLFLIPSLSTIGVTSVRDLIAGRAAITQAVPVVSEIDHALIKQIDADIAALVESER